MKISFRVVLILGLVLGACQSNSNTSETKSSEKKQSDTLALDSQVRDVIPPKAKVDSELNRFTLWGVTESCVAKF